jgi:hypothetical protein
MKPTTRESSLPDEASGDAVTCTEFSERCTEAPLWGIRAVPELGCRKSTNKHSFAGKDAEHAIIDAGKRALSVASEPLFSRTVLYCRNGFLRSRLELLR